MFSILKDEKMLAFYFSYKLLPKFWNCDPTFNQQRVRFSHVTSFPVMQFL